MQTDNYHKFIYIQILVILCMFNTMRLISYLIATFNGEGVFIGRQPILLSFAKFAYNWCF